MCRRYTLHDRLLGRRVDIQGRVGDRLLLCTHASLLVDS